MIKKKKSRRRREDDDFIIKNKQLAYFIDEEELDGFSFDNWKFEIYQGHHLYLQIHGILFNISSLQFIAERPSKG